MKEFKKKGFTLIELIVVIAILGILVLLALPKFLGHTEDAKLVQIKNDVKVIENALEIKLLDDSDYIANKGWESISLETMNGYVEEGSLFDSKGKVDEELQGGEFYIIEDELAKTKLNGQFIAEKGGKVYYYEKGLNVGGDESGNGSKYVLATNEDFEFVEDNNGYDVNGEKGYFKYIGDEEYVEIPHVIQGIEMTSYYKMFNKYEGSQLKGVKSTNTNITDISLMFADAKNITELDLSEFNTSNVKNMFGVFLSFDSYTLQSLNLSNWDTSNVESMSNMFFGQKELTKLDLSSFNTSNVTNMKGMFSGTNSLTELDLSKFDTSNVTDMSYMFNGASSLTELDLSSFDTSKMTETNMIDMFFRADNLTKGYARTQDDADKFNASKGKPEDLTFCVKGTANCN